jgi:carbon-monoxide dehydrogenase medium subunit
MYQFDYQTPKSAADVVTALKADEDAKIVAGGMTLIPTLKQRLAMPTTLIDLRGIPELKGVREDGGALVIGAMTTHAEVWADPTVQSKAPALSFLAGKIGDAQVRNRGTIGGSIANADPAADYPAAVLAMNATIVTDSREIAADDMFTGLFETALNEDEIITAVRFPLVKRAGYAKFRHPASRYAVVGVMVTKTDAGVRVGVTGAGPNAFRVPEMEQALASNFSPDAVATIKVSAEDLNSDIHASAEYRAHLVTVMAKRAVEAAMG